MNDWQDRPIGKGRSEIPLVLLSRDEGYVADLAHYLSQQPVDIVLAATVGTQPELAAAVMRIPSPVVLIDGDLPDDLTAAASTAVAAGAARVLLLVPDLNKRQAPPPGTEVIFKYLLGTTLVERIRSLSDDGLHPDNSGPATLSTTAPSPSLSALRASTTGEPALFAFFSPKGGTGSSTLSANLAYLYASKGKRVVLVDLARYGSQHVILRQPQRSQGLSSLVTLLSQDPAAANSPRMAAYMQQALQPITIGRVQFQLLPAAHPARIDQISHEHVRAIVQHLGESGRQVILIDLSAELTDRVKGALSLASRVVIPVTPDIVSTWHALQTRDMLTSLVGLRSKLTFLINRYRSDSRFDPQEFQRLGGGPLLGVIPEDSRGVAGDLAVGRLTATRPEAPFTRALLRVGQQLLPVFSPSELARRNWPWSKE